MVFSSLMFMCIFLPIVLIAYNLSKNLTYKNTVLIIASLFFYAWGEPIWVVLLIFSAFVDYINGRIIDKYYARAGATIALVSSLVINLGLLAMFKYSGFFIENINSFLHTSIPNPNFKLPIGISFYTFQTLSYTIDMYRGKTRVQKSFLGFLAYVSMFPQLIAGPIVTYDEISDRLYRRKITAKTVLRGVGVFIFGLGLKVLLANPLGKLWSQAQAIGFESLSTPLAWMSVIAFSLQLYFDFFGYSLMAVGLGKMLGFTLPENFKHPYVSVTMTEFWRRWHITLGRWFRDYVYIPLGGNRKGTPRTTINLLIVWLLTGLWHGAGYNYLLWGLILFLIILSEKLWTGKLLNKHKLFGHVYMIFLIPLTWTVFAVNDITQLGFLFTRLFPFFGKGAWSVFRYDYLKYLGQYYLFFIAGIFLSTTLPYKLLKKVPNRNDPLLL